MKKYATVLTIAGSDSGGGAGIQADLKTFSALGCYGMTVVTAVTAQNTTGVKGVYPLAVQCVEEQIDAVLSDIGAGVVKIGMLWSSELVVAVAGMLKKYNISNIVLDPVMVAQSGDSLLKGDISNAYKEHLLPITKVFTPNLSEAAILLKRKIETIEDMETAAKEFSLSGCESVLVKGGHLSGKECTDVFYINTGNEVVYLKEERVDTANNHGTGCTLSSAIAAYLSRGLSLREAVVKAKKYITGSLLAGAGYSVGQGHGSVHHFYEVW